ncbi:Outer membrane porin F [Andreprevotia sp. IGB-42]|uniref:OmpA family protein n=1 Tax=Andreprevotia sp. IGB-42 TaxID=2497473 RepID=UPI001357E451|nr:OmpA family protein [Andreprevotia sp. IGB-42]KAF0814489.1 Outer membrane porin F [Andreprevotia sp. IGB-42]
MTKRNRYTTPVLLTIAALLAACSSVPKTTSLLEQTRSDYQLAQNNPDVVRYAPLELKQAGDALAAADVVAKKGDDAASIDKLAYVAKQKVALAQEAGKKKTAEADVATAGKERDQLRLDQRTQEADKAKLSAAQADAATKAAQGETAEAQTQIQLANARAARFEAQLAELAAKKTDRGMVITLGDVLFGTDQSRLTADGMRTAQKLADVLTQNPERKVLIEGFTDNTGSDAHNQELSERRATTVQSALVGMGIASARVSTRGYGESRPVAANDTAQNRQLNRRVEIVLSDVEGKMAQR